MRRGAPLNQPKRAPVMSDLDVEGGGNAGYGSSPDSGSFGSENSSGYPMPPNSSGSGGGGGGLSYDSGKAKRRAYHGYQSLLMGAAGSMSNSLLQKCIALLAAGIIIGAMMLPLQMRILWVVYGAVVFGAMVSMWLSKNVLSCDDGTPEMRAVVCVLKNVVIFVHIMCSVHSLSNFNLCLCIFF